MLSLPIAIRISFIFLIVQCTLITGINGKVRFILVGLPKAGTSSFHSLFSELGLKSLHYNIEIEPNEITESFILAGKVVYDAKQQGLPLLAYLQEYDAITEINVIGPSYGLNMPCYFPQIEDLNRLYEENKDAVFILNTRTVYNHVRSIKFWYSFLDLFNEHCSHYFNNKLTENVEERMHDLILDHNESVRKFFRYHNNSKFVEFNIETDNISKLTQYIDLKGISTFPHANQNPILSGLETRSQLTC